MGRRGRDWGSGGGTGVCGELVGGLRGSHRGVGDLGWGGGCGQIFLGFFGIAAQIFGKINRKKPGYALLIQSVGEYLAVPITICKQVTTPIAPFSESRSP